MKTASILKINFTKAASVLLAALLLFNLSAPAGAEAATYAYVTQFLKITVPDDTLVMTQSTSKYDDVWDAAGITDPGSALDEFSDMGVTAAFCDPATKVTVRFSSKKTLETVEKFTFAGLSDDEITSYMSSVVEGGESDGMGVSLTIRRDLNQNVPFFRMLIDATKTERPCTEVIYGTMINGEMLQFDVLKDGLEPVDDSFAEQVVRGIEFTRVLTPAEYEEEVAAAKTKLTIIIVAALVVLGGLIALSVVLRKRKEKRTKKISAAMTDFRFRMRDGKIDLAAAPKYEFRSQYDLPLLDEFGVFSAWFNPEPGFALAVVLFAGVTVYMIKTVHLLLALLMAVLVIVLLYTHYNQAEKVKAALITQYGAKEKPTAVFKFYDEYFTVSGLGTATDYIYGQVTAVRSFAHSVYVFVGDTHALIIRKADMEGVSVKDLRELIRK